MNEDDLRRALQAHGADDPVDQPPWSAIEQQAAGRTRRSWRGTWPIAIAAAAAILVAGVVVSRPDPEPTRIITADDPTTTTSAPTTTTTAFPDPASVGGIYPDRAAYERDGLAAYSDPLEVARVFAREYLGMGDPQVEVVSDMLVAEGTPMLVRPNKRAAITTELLLVAVGNGAYWTVAGAKTAGIVPDLSPDTVVASPLRLTGRARAYEGHVNVELRQNGDWRTPLATTFVTGASDALSRFSGSLRFTPPAGDAGAIVFAEPSAEDGSTLAATVVRVRFR